MALYSFSKYPVAIDRLTQEIEMSSIATTPTSIMSVGTQLDIEFPSSLSSPQQTTLSSLVTAHDGTPLSIEFNELSSSTTTSTNSSSYVLLNGMQSPYLLAGTYWVTFSGSFSTTIPLLSYPAIYVGVFANGTLVPASEQTTATNLTGATFNISLACKVTIGTNERIDIRWKNNGVLNTISCYTRVLDIMRLS